MDDSFNSSFAKSIIELKLQVDKIIESQNMGAFTAKYKMLYLIMFHAETSPQQLISSLNMAKSNLAQLAKKLVQEGLINQVKEVNNKKQIYYIISEKGKKELLAKMNKINNINVKKDEVIECLKKLSKTL